MQRRKTTPTRVGNIIIGGDETIKVQSMTTTNTNDTEACVSQAKRIINAGGELVRLTTQGRREAENMKNISDALKAENVIRILHSLFYILHLTIALTRLGFLSINKTTKQQDNQTT